MPGVELGRYLMADNEKYHAVSSPVKLTPDS